MDRRGLRSVLQPVLYVGAASILHALLFLIPGGGTAKRDAGTTRGIRVKTFVESPPAVAPSARERVAPSRPEPSATIARPPDAARDQYFSVEGSRTASANSRDVGQGDSGVRGRGPSIAGEGDASRGDEQPRGGEPEASAYGLYLSKLRSSGVQGWAKDSAQRTQQGWKGSGVGGGTAGWGKGSKSSKGTEGDARTAGSGTGTWGTGTGGDGARYMDPRVRMIVSSYPPSGIEHRYTLVRYPDLKFKKSDYTSGWWNVYIEIGTNRNGKITRYRLLRPETDGPLERQFVAQVKKEIEKWTFDPIEAEIHVDVRFHVE